MSQSATPARQNDMTTCLETSRKEMFCSFPHRHGGKATRKPETRDETRGSIKTNISCETSANFHSWRPTKRICFAASPIDTAKPQENQRLETRHAGAARRTFRARLPPIFTVETFEKEMFCSFPHRHGEATGKPETRDETRGSIKTSISCEISSNFDTLQPQNRRFPADFLRNL